MILRQYLRFAPAVTASYLVGCAGKAVGAVIDPVEPAEFYLEEAGRNGLKLTFVLDTHLHADHLSTGRELARLAGAEYLLHRESNTQFDFSGVGEGDTLDLENVEGRVVHTPGHTPEHLTLLITDKTRSAEPWLAFTGHTLMVGDVGRTELAANLEEGAVTLFESLQKLKKLPDYVEIFPGAFAGSVCGRALSGKPMSTIGFERRFNKAFRVEDRAAFVELMSKDVPPPPAGAEHYRAINMGRAGQEIESRVSR